MDEKANSDYEEYLMDDSEKESSKKNKIYKSFLIQTQDVVYAFLVAVPAVARMTKKFQKNITSTNGENIW